MTTFPQFDKLASCWTNPSQDYSKFFSDSWNIYLQSANVMTRGCEEIMSSLSNLYKTCYENNMSASKTIMSSRSWQDAVEAQTQAIKSQSELVSGEVSKLSEMTSRLAQDAMNPITQHVNSAISKATTSFSQAA